jgi:hypothetical protein
VETVAGYVPGKVMGLPTGQKIAFGGDTWQVTFTKSVHSPIGPTTKLKLAGLPLTTVTDVGEKATLKSATINRIGTLSVITPSVATTLNV